MLLPAWSCAPERELQPETKGKDWPCWWLARKPQSLDEFAHIKGVGEKKLADLGLTFLRVIHKSRCALTHQMLCVCPQ